MSSSDDRRRPRVAGQRRRHGRSAGVDGAPRSVELDGAPRSVELDGAPRSVELDGAPRSVELDGAPRSVELDAGTPRSLELRDLRAPLAVLVVALLAFALVAAVSLRDHGARERDSRAATAAARAALEQLLSYDYRSVAERARQNEALLTGPFRSEYAQTMATTIAPMAQQEKAVVQARTVEAGVMGQTPDTVTVQLFLNQAKTAEGDEQPSVDQNRVIATMRRVEGRWLVERLSAY